MASLAPCMAVAAPIRSSCMVCERMRFSNKRYNIHKDHANLVTKGPSRGCVLCNHFFCPAHKSDNKAAQAMIDAGLDSCNSGSSSDSDCGSSPSTPEPHPDTTREGGQYSTFEGYVSAAAPKTADEKTRPSNGYDPVVFVPIADRIQPRDRTPTDPKTLRPFALLPDWRTRFPEPESSGEFEQKREPVGRWPNLRFSNSYGSRRELGLMYG
ncbi:uncharacterized protein LTR77_010648 [Saxophila tyrrhenica]|uniref:Uncharacterized protein n=1 Tax=Saxophila tyrrhenica TaxID=1690608 RepID=A0AAV9NYL5_9PEZI|nr:hypothetical protein LTR77_010648 [Saxophila tyrrhenica]